MKGFNYWEASRLYRAVKQHLSRKRRFCPEDEGPIFRAGQTPQQTNGYDCGLYVMAIAKVICQWYCNDDPDKDVNWIQEVVERVDVTLEFTLRSHVLGLIEEASCGRLGSVSCIIEAPKEEGGASDCGTPKDEGASDCGTPKDEGATRMGPVPDSVLDDEGCANDCGKPTGPGPGPVPDDGGANNCGTSAWTVLE